MVIYFSWEEAPKTSKLICVTLGKVRQGPVLLLFKGYARTILTSGHKIVVSLLVTVTLVL